jgi:tetratricopeptide (TPR) repeat protein
MNRTTHRVVLGSFVLVAMMSAIAPAAEKPGPATKPYTYIEYSRDLLDFNRKTVVEPYQKIGKRDPKWDAKAIAYLEEIVQQWTQSPLPDFYRPHTSTHTYTVALPLGQALVDLGCDDPMVLYCHAGQLMDSGKRKEALPLLRQAVKGMRASKYPSYRKAIAEDRLGRLTDDPAEATEVAQIAQAEWMDACCGKHSDIERREIVDSAWSRMQTRAAQQAFVQALAARNDADPWVKGVITGRLEIKLAWDSRGSGWANTVTEEGWKGFHQHLTLARDAFAGAYKDAPHLPEPATDMITVAMGAGDVLNEKPMEWFERALQAQIDCDEAYRLMIGGPMLPRWGGSYEEMMQLAEACVAQERFDTSVPMYYLTIVRQIGTDSGRPWVLLGNERAYGQIVKVTEGYAAAVAKDKAPYYKSLHAAAAWRVGKLPEARKVLDELTAAGMKPHPHSFVYFGGDDGAAIISSVYALTGDHAAVLKEAQTKARNGEAAAALKDIKSIAEKLPKDDPAQDYFAGQIFEFDAKVKFDAGEWSPMQTGKGRSGWKWVRGSWTADGKGGLVGHSDRKNPNSPWGLLTWMGSESGRSPGQSFEVQGVLEFPEPGPGVHFANGSVNLNPAQGAPTKWFTLEFNRELGVVSIINGKERMNAQKKVALKSPCAFTVRVADRKVTLFVNGEPVADRFPLPPELNGDLSVGLGVNGPDATTFRNLMIRKILPEGQKKP